MPEGPGSEPPASQQPVPLSQSSVWAGLREFYAGEGISAWDGRVPFHITSNPLIADGYANVALRFIRDVAATGRFDATEPFYVVELGAGSGKFGFHLVRRLAQLMAELDVGGLRMVYLMTDVVAANIDYWCRHPRLQPYVDSGQLAFGRFDLMADHAVQVISRDGRRAELATFVNPPVVIANYVFDSVPQDIFSVTDAQLEVLVVNLVPATDDERSDDRATTRLVGIRRPAAQPRYADADADALLVDLAAQCGDQPVVMPIAALQCLNRLVAASAGRLCLLASDLGPSEGPAGDVDLELGQGVFYLPVDLNVIAGYLARLGAGSREPRLGLHRISRSSALDTCLSVVGFDPTELRETEHAFSGYIEAFGARGHKTIAALVARAGAALVPDQWLSLASMLRYDGRLLDESVALLSTFAGAGALTPRQRQELLTAIELIVANTYWVPAAKDTLFNAGVVLHELGEVEAALEAFTISLEATGESPETLFSLGLCQESLGCHANALASFRRAVALDPKHVLARGWTAQVELDAQAHPGPG